MGDTYEKNYSGKPPRGLVRGGMGVGRTLMRGCVGGGEVSVGTVAIEGIEQLDRRRLITTSPSREPRVTGIGLNRARSTFECTGCETGYDLPFGE
jgi:hypothetical protein